MASDEPSLSTFVYPHSRSMDEKKWLSIVKDIIKKEPFSESETEVSIFIVPRTLMIISPDCYTPQHVALGPNHYWRPELHDMEGYKIAAAKRVQRELRSQNLNFEGLVKQFTEHYDADIRARYQRFIYFEKEDLVWVMAIDSAFMLEFLHVIYSMQGGKKSKEAKITSNKQRGSLAFPCGGSHFAESTSIEVLTEADTLPPFTHDLYGRRIARNAIVRDMVMLENQIPLFLLREMLKYRFSEERANNTLPEMLKAFREKFCPFKFVKYLEKAAVLRCDHLLDYMYSTILQEDGQISDFPSDIKDQCDRNKNVPSQNPSAIINLLSKSKEVLGQVRVPKKLKPLCKPVTVLVGITLTFSKLKGEGSSVGSDGDCKKPPEIAIPSATELARAGVHFSPIQDGDKFKSISFDAKKATFYFPPIKLDDNTEVILRNLVAYEASRHGSLYFTRYTELMNGIIDTAEDVGLLKKRGIIRNYLKSDEEAANMWNGMSRSIKKKKVPELDEVIISVNKYYNSRWMIKAERFMRTYVYESWMFLSFMAAVLLLLIELFEGFCSVYDCNKLLHFK